MKKPQCDDCGLRYSSFGVDAVLSNKQWKIVSGRSDGGGMLCANCIAKRAKSLGCARVFISLGLPCELAGECFEIPGRACQPCREARLMEALSWMFPGSGERSTG
jgi:hypothetical protein